LYLKIPTAYSVVRSSSRSSPVYNIVLNTAYCYHHTVNFAATLEPPSEEVLERVRSEFGLNEERVRDAVEHLKDWIQLQPHLPQEIGTFCLRLCEQHQTVHNSKHIILSGNKLSEIQGICVSCRNVPVQCIVSSRFIHVIRSSDSKKFSVLK